MPPAKRFQGHIGFRCRTRLKTRLNQYANGSGVDESQLARALIASGLDDLEAGDVQIGDVLEAVPVDDLEQQELSAGTIGSERDA